MNVSPSIYSANSLHSQPVATRSVQQQRCSCALKALATSSAGFVVGGFVLIAFTAKPLIIAGAIAGIALIVIGIALAIISIVRKCRPEVREKMRESSVRFSVPLSTTVPSNILESESKQKSTLQNVQDPLLTEESVKLALQRIEARIASLEKYEKEMEIIEKDWDNAFAMLKNPDRTKAYHQGVLRLLLLCENFERDPQRTKAFYAIGLEYERGTLGYTEQEKKMLKHEPKSLEFKKALFHLALSYYFRATVENDDEVMYQLGRKYHYGFDVSPAVIKDRGRDRMLAFQWYSLAAHHVNNNTKAMVAFADMLEEGIGSKNNVVACPWLANIWHLHAKKLDPQHWGHLEIKKTGISTSKIVEEHVNFINSCDKDPLTRPLAVIVGSRLINRKLMKDHGQRLKAMLWIAEKYEKGTMSIDSNSSPNRALYFHHYQLAVHWYMKAAKIGGAQVLWKLISKMMHGFDTPFSDIGIDVQACLNFLKDLAPKNSCAAMKLAEYISLGEGEYKHYTAENRQALANQYIKQALAKIKSSGDNT